MVSIVIPAYNAEKYILRCIDSCVRQTYQNIEIIVVDDGSTDDTIKKCATINDNRLKVISKKNAGVSEARNTGLQVAQGNYLFFLDADDYLDRDCCAMMVGAMKNDVDLVVCGYNRIDLNDERQRVCAPETIMFALSEKITAINYMKQINCLFTCWNKLYRREKIQFEFDKSMSFAEDSVFVFDYLAECKKIIVLDYIGYNYWIGTEGSAMKKFHADMFQMIKKEYKKILDSDQESEDIRSFAFNHYIENVIYFCAPQLIVDERYNFNQKTKLISQIWMIDGFDNMIANYKPQRKLHYLYRALMKKKCTLLLTLLFKLNI